MESCGIYVSHELGYTWIRERFSYTSISIYNMWSVLIMFIRDIQDGSTALKIAREAGHKDIAILLYAYSNFKQNVSSVAALCALAVACVWL